MPQGNQAALQILPQVDKNTPNTDFVTATLMNFLSESLKGDVTKYGSQALARRSQRNKNLVRAGTVNVNGTVDFEATNHTLHTLLPLAFKRTAAAPVNGTHDAIYTPYVGDATYATIRVNDSEVSRIYESMVLSQLDFSAEVDQLVRLNTTWEGVKLRVQADSAAGGVNPTNEYGLYFEQGEVLFGDEQLTNAVPVFTRSFNLSINRNAKTDRFGLGSQFKRDVPVSTYDITGSINIDANSLTPDTDKAALFKAAMETKMLSLRLTFVDPGNPVEGGKPSKFVLTVPFALIDWPDHNITSEDFLEGTVNFTSYADPAPAEVVAGTEPTDQFSIRHVYTLN